MSKTKSLKKNIVYNVVFQILNIIVPIFTAPYVFRILGKEGIGLYGYSYSIAHYFSLFCMLGILNYGNREISMVSSNLERKSEIFWQIYSIQFIAGLISLISYFLFISCFEASYYKVFLIQGLFVFATMFDICWFYFGIEDFRFTTIISIINKALTTALIFLIIKSSSHVCLYAALLAAGGLFNNIFYWIYINKHVVISNISFKKTRSHLKPIILLFIPVIAVNIYKYIDKIMLGIMLNVSEVGVFEAAEKLQNLPMCLVAAIGTVMLPRISNMISNSENTAVKHYNSLSFILVMFLTIGMAFGLAGIAHVFIPLFYGNGYEDSELVLLLLLPSMVFVGWANIIRTQYLLPNRLDMVFCGSVIAGAIVNVISNFIFIPLFGAVGAAISTTIAEFSVCLYQSVVAFKKMELSLSLKNCLPFFAIGFIMYIVITHIYLDSAILTVGIRLVLGSLLYLFLSVLFLKKHIPIRLKQ